ncbi:hypothetical protein GCM10011504_55140 [Siccirubricoccus deserti]|nr:hypothetical protein GCM10011504_55140 [Siccirubricoccus deserti]
MLRSGLAVFMPTFQATIPDILPEEAEYTKPLSASRLVYDLDALARPAMATSPSTPISVELWRKAAAASSARRQGSG